MTGKELKLLWNQTIDSAFTGYLDNTKLNRLFKEALTNVIQHIYLNRLNNQNSFDEISYLIAANQVLTVNSATNTIFSGDYVSTIQTLTNIGTTVTVTTVLPHDLQTGNKVTFENVTGTFNIGTFNGQTYAVTVTGAKTFTFTSTFTNVGVFASGEIAFPESITDYYHYLWAEARFTKLFENVLVTGSTNKTPIKITLDKITSLRTRSQVVISGVIGNSNANGTFYVKQANEFEYFLYQDINLTIPIVGNGTQTGTGRISQVVKSELKFKRSDEKGSVYGSPTIDSPFFQQTKNQLLILPIESPCDSIRIDYIRKPTFEIDVNDDTRDLTDFYPLPFQYQINDEAAKIFAISQRDGQFMQTEQGKLQENP